jgi:hypothetical protein
MVEKKKENLEEERKLPDGFTRKSRVMDRCREQMGRGE